MYPGTLKVCSGYCCACPEWIVDFTAWWLYSSALAYQLQGSACAGDDITGTDTVREESDGCQKMDNSDFSCSGSKRIILTVAVGLSGEGPTSMFFLLHGWDCPLRSLRLISVLFQAREPLVPRF